MSSGSTRVIYLTPIDLMGGVIDITARRELLTIPPGRKMATETTLRPITSGGGSTGDVEAYRDATKIASMRAQGC